MVEFYRCNRDYQRVMARIEKDKRVSSSNKKLADKFLRHLLARDMSPSTITTYMNRYHRLCRMTKKDIARLTDKDIENIQIENNKMASYSTKKQHNKMMRILLQYLGKYKHETHSQLMKLHYKEDHQLTVNSQDLFTSDELKAMINAASPMYRAMISIQNECGMRPGELCSLQIGCVEHETTYSKVQIIESKTVKRTNIVISGDAYLREWIAQHPRKDDKTAPLFPVFHEGNIAYLTPDAYRKMIKKLALQVGIKRRVWGYLGRHTGITRMLREGYTSPMVQQTVGHSIGGSTIKKYNHMTDNDVHNYIREKSKEKEQKAIAENKELDYVLCNFCQAKNTFEAYYCTECARPLNLKALAEIENKKKALEEGFLDFMKYACKKHPELAEEYVLSEESFKWHKKYNVPYPDESPGK